jgi:hypothetical protein
MILGLVSAKYALSLTLMDRRGIKTVVTCAISQV